MLNRAQRWLNEAKLLIFDLDGTLYEDTDHFDYFTSLLQEKLPADRQKAFGEEYEKMKNGEHPVTIGKAYDAIRDTVITVDPMNRKATAACSWDGREWAMDEVRETYPERLLFNFNTMIAIGDGWWLPQTTARHFGLSGSDTRDCYNKTKEYMATDAFQLTKTPGLKTGLLRLKREKKTVLLTNSGRDDVNRLLNQLDLSGLFDEIIPAALKPAQTEFHFKKIMATNNMKPEETVSIGDNFMNEVAPALTLGMKAIYIQTQGTTSSTVRNLCVVHSLADIYKQD